MEPVSAHLSNSGLLRPVSAIGAESSVLRDGRMAAEVLQSYDDGTVLLRVGSERVPAKTEVPLAPGDTLALMAERRDGELVLRVLSRGFAMGDKLAQMLGGLIGESRSVGAEYSNLSAALGAAAQGGDGTAEARALLGSLEKSAFQPGEGGAELASKLGGGGQLELATLLTAAMATREADDLEALLKRLASAIRGRLSAPLVPTGTSVPEQALFQLLPGLLERALKEARHGADTRTVRGLRAFLGKVESELARLLGQSNLPTETIERALAHLSNADGRLLQGYGTALLRALVLMDGRHALERGPGQAAIQSLDSDPLGRWFLALDAIRDGAAQEGLAGRFTRLVLEQLLNAARSANGEALHYAFPILEGGVPRTVDLFVTPDRRMNSEGQRQEGYRLVVGVELSQLGPVRADFFLWEQRLTVRLQAEWPQTVQRLGERAAGLEAALSASGLPLQLSVQQVSRGEARVEERVHDIRYLRENHLIDLEG